MTIIRHTDAEVLQELADIIWPCKNPERQWSPDTIQEVADTLAMLRPELLPWGFGCLAYHGWAQNALDCAIHRELRARLNFTQGTGPIETLWGEEDTIDALTALACEDDDDD